MESKEDYTMQKDDQELHDGISVLVADASHEKYVDTILQTIAEAAKDRGTGIAKRTHDYLATKMREAKAVIALAGDRFAGFSYIETWGNKQYVTTSGLIVHPDFRHLGIAKRIKDMTFTLARIRWPHAKIFSLTSGKAVMKMNTALGYQPVTFDDLTDDEAFWRGCEGCVNYPVLKERNRKFCICTAMLFDPEEHLPARIPQEVLDRIKKADHPRPLLKEGSKDNRRPKWETADDATYDLLKHFAEQNRKNPTEAESILWIFLKGKQLGVTFRRQYIVGQFIADFICIKLKLILEVDGGYHQLPEQQIKDEDRRLWLEQHGYHVLRLSNEEVIASPENVLNKIKEQIWKITNK